MISDPNRPGYILPVIIFSQFAGTSLWFAGNAIIPDLNLGSEFTGWILSSVQLGFIVGTFFFALFSISDRFSTRLIFLLCAALGGVFNLSIIWFPTPTSILFFRFLTGMCLAGIYPVGMKIAASWYKKGLGIALGFLVGALVLGSAFPHLVRSFEAKLNWEQVLISVSALSISGGIAMYLMVPQGPYIKKSPHGLDWGAIKKCFKTPNFRNASFGYFGHMWELYAFWAFIPVFITYYSEYSGSEVSTSLSTFMIIGIGSIGCILAGYISMKKGSKLAARSFLLVSGICCILSPFIIEFSPLAFFILMAVWGISVIGDSAQFSALNAQFAPAELVGTALTIVTSIGFAVTIFSIELLNFMSLHVSTKFLFWLLIPGPVFGLLFSARLPNKI